MKESLDLCLACKGCNSDCPVGVDVATYKSEFLSHYYETNPRPAEASGAFEFRLVAASRVARRAGESCDPTPWPPRLGQAGRRNPRPAPHSALSAGNVQTVVERSVTRSAGLRGLLSLQKPGNPVLLWADTFNNHFLPSTAKAAVEVLEAAGFAVFVPRAHLLLRPPALRHRHDRPRQEPAPPDHGRACFPKSKPRPLSSFSNRVAPPSSATNSRTFSPKTNARTPSRSKSSCSANFSNNRPMIFHFRNSRARRSSTGIAITRPS